jgi:subtilisin
MLLAGARLAPIPTAAASDPAPAPSSYIVALRSDAGDPAVAAAMMAAEYGFAVDNVYQNALAGFAADLTPAALTAVAADPRVASVEPDGRIATDGQITPAGVERVKADVSPTASIDENPQPPVDADVAILDTGIDTTHPDLAVTGGANCAAKGKGYDDHYGHGTGSAGIVGALDNGVGVVGVAPGVRLWAVRVLDDDGNGTTRELLCGIDWVTATRTDTDPSNDIEVANLSLGGAGSDDGQCGAANNDLLHQAICRSVGAGVTYVVAAGNDHVDAGTYSPASYREVITVSALADADGRPGSSGGSPRCRADQDDTLADFSNYGSVVDLIAPGVCVLTTVPPESKAVGTTNGYGQLSGTSFAAPHVAGAAALYIAQHPGATPAQVRDALIATASSDWNNVDDPDGIKEPLIDVEAF